MSKTTEGRLQVYVEPALVERAKREAFWTPGLTLSALVEEALRRELARREEERGGEKLPDRTGPLKEGQPLKLKAPDAV